MQRITARSLKSIGVEAERRLIFRGATVAKLKLSEFLILFLCVLVSTSVSGQGGPNPSVQGNTARVSLNVLYQQFLAYQLHLDDVATSIDRQGQDGGGFRNHNQKELGFTDAEFSVVRAAAVRLEQKLKEQDAKARPVIDAARGKLPKQINSPTDIPQVPPEVGELQKERDAIIEGEVQGLKAILGPKQAARMDSYLQNQFAPNVTFQKESPLHQYNPSHSVIAPVTPGVRP